MLAVQVREWVTGVVEPEKTSTVVTNTIPPASIELLYAENPLAELGAKSLPATVQPRVKSEETSELTYAEHLTSVTPLMGRVLLVGASVNTTSGAERRIENASC